MCKYLVLGVIALTLFTGAATATPALDPPRIVRWHVIGNVFLGSDATRVEYTYGEGKNPLASDYTTLYRVPGDKLQVIFRRRHVVGVGTTSKRYRTSDGFGVGSFIPLKRGLHESSYCWEGFKLQQTLWWKIVTQRGRKIIIHLQVNKGVVIYVGVSDLKYWLDD